MLGKEFVTAGRAIFTVEVPAEFSSENATQTHYTFKVVRKPAKDGYRETFFVNLLTGPDNTSDYTYLGIINAETGKVILTKASKFSDDTWPVRIVRRVLACLWDGTTDRIEAAGWQLHHNGYCGRCASLLTVPSSIESGFGPECIEKICSAA